MYPYLTRAYMYDSYVYTTTVVHTLMCTAGFGSRIAQNDWDLPVPQKVKKRYTFIYIVQLYTYCTAVQISRFIFLFLC